MPLSQSVSDEEKKFYKIGPRVLPLPPPSSLEWWLDKSLLSGKLYSKALKLAVTR
jgi:hypothetical protein